MSKQDDIAAELSVKIREATKETDITGTNAAFFETPESLRIKLLDKETIDKQKRVGMSEQRIRDVLPKLRKLFSFYRAYPDIYLDSIVDPHQHFSLKPYQRILLRVMLRYRYVFATFPRGYSKSFLAILANYLKCIFYPNSKVFLVSPGKQQSMSIIQEKVNEIWDIWPALKNEVIIGREAASSKMQSNLFNLKFKNGSFFDVVPCSEHARGLRRTAGIIEESAKIDGKLLSNVIIPTMNISRRAANGKEDPNDMTNKSQCYITSAGSTSCFAYDKMSTIFLWSLLRPEESICLGGTWRLPVIYGLLDKNFVEDLKSDGTYSVDTFAKEYESQWVGETTTAFFDADSFDRCRTVKDAMFAAPEKMPRGARIVLGYDVGRSNDLSTCVVLYMEPQANGTYIKKVVNIFAWDGVHFNIQANNIKKLLMRYNATKVVIDANGPGLGLIDFLTVKTVDKDTGVEYPAIGVDRECDTTNTYSNFYQVEEPLYNEKIWLMRASDRSNTVMHNLVSSQISSGKLRFLIPDNIKKDSLSRSTEWAHLTDEQKVKRLQPFVMTRILRQEMMNLRRTTEDTANITLKKIKSTIKKDKFSALEYGLWYCRKLELERRHSTSFTTSLNLASSGSQPNGGQIDFSKRISGFKRESFSRRS